MSTEQGTPPADNPPPTPSMTPPASPLGYHFPEDKYRHGRILKYFPQSGYGFIKDEQGRETYFHLDEIRFIGQKNDRRYVSEGAPVGFDVGITSRGTRVTYLKLY